MKSVTPLPATLSGNIIQRLIQIDEALIPYVSGSLVWLCDKEPFEETGTLTVDEAKLLFSDMLQIYFTESPTVQAIGAYLMSASDNAPPKYLLCDGTAYSRTTYAELFTEIGTNYGAGNGTTTFNVPDFRDRSPMGAGGDFVGSPGAVAGEHEHTLTVFEMPTHNHGISDPGHTHPPLSPNTTFLGARPSGGANVAAGTTVSNAVTTGSATTGIGVDNTGDGLPHNNLHPVMGVKWWIYAGV